MQADIIFKYFPDLTTVQKAQFEALEGLYNEWNAQINVISRKDIDELYVKHVLHSLAIAKVVKFKPNADILDVGTGGGFPGIPLAILFPESNFHLIDSIGKKIKVVKAISESLGLKNVKVENIRVEQVKDKYDFVVSRAVTRLKPFYIWVRNKFKKERNHRMSNGILYLKGGDLQSELSETKKKTKLFELSDYFDEAFFETKKIVYLPVK
ncbi:MAG TPA: 16S rRNA (guanine(527)-N(7))-methyltransferase RsmG [Fulvivirga sp.]|nr:16S rRNA (guanine(527)-N(7))-methyltransferase RsmG [Fulvivirga sp.]